MKPQQVALRDERTKEELQKMDLIKRFVNDEEGADATEYALIIGLIALAIVVAVQTLGTKLSTGFNNIGNTVATSVGS
jgi:pilus assembly protein Flp/PilA